MDESSKAAGFQEVLARKVVVTSIIVVGICAVVAISAAAYNDKVSDTAKTILTTILPVIGTWVGTILAFYFGSENFKAAAEETRATLGKRLARPAREVAIASQAIRAHKVKDEAAARAVELAELSKAMEDAGFFRLPILAESGAPLFVLHRQPLDSFIVQQARKGADKAALEGLKLSDLLASEIGKSLQDSFVTVGADATLADAKAAMESRPECQDVFLTTDGRRTGVVVGWLPNNEIQRAATAG